MSSNTYTVESVSQSKIPFCGKKFKVDRIFFCAITQIKTALFNYSGTTVLHSTKVLLIALIFFILPLISKTYATVVINEFLPNPSGPSSEETEWIELFNTEGSPVILDNWKLDDIDGGGASPYTIASGTAILANGYLSFEKSVTGVGLNNTGDTIRLINVSGTVVDSYAFTSTAEDVSIGRTVDGGGSFVACQTQTKGSPNTCLLPTSTPTTTSTKSPTNAPTNTTTNTPTITPTSQSFVSKTPTPTKKGTPTYTPTQTTSPTPLAEVLGLGVDANKSIESSPSANVFPIKPIIISLLFIAAGLGLLSIVFVLRKRKPLGDTLEN